jgi:Transposase IS4
MFPNNQLVHMVNMNRLELNSRHKKTTTAGEILQPFGVFILATKYEFTSWKSWWSNKPFTTYESAPSFARTGMTRHRSEDLNMCLRFSTQPSVIPEAMNSEQYRWLLGDDFVRNFNNHRHTYFNPSELLCIDESMVRWYGMGAIGSTRACQTTWQLIASPKRVVRYRISLVARVG